MEKLVGTLLKFLPRLWLSRLVRFLTQLHLEPVVLRPIIWLYGRIFSIEMGEVQRPPGGFKSFGQFFVRPLKPGARPIAPGDATWVAPCDGKISNFGPLQKGEKIEQVKGVDYSLEDLVGGKDWSQALLGGSYMTIYLSPRDYHRVHAPMTGKTRVLRYIPGDLWPVNSLGLQQIPGLFVRNERVAIQCESPQGTFLLVMVGALNVGSIRLVCEPSLRTNFSRPKGFTKKVDWDFQKGQELGRFEMGSTVILILPASMGFAKGLASGEALRMGEALGEG